MKLLHYAAIAVLVWMGLLLVWVNVSLFWPVRTLEIKNYASPGVVLTDAGSYKLGHPVGYVLDYCKYTDDAASVSRDLVDGQIITLSNSNGYLPIGCHKTLVETAIIPGTINLGRYYLDIVVRYRINLLRTEVVHYHTNYFSVVR